VPADADLLFRPVHELAGLVRSGELSARELVEASLERIDALNPALNAVILVDAERALAAADAVGRDDERPFAGVPIALKDETPAEGLRLTFGSRIWGDFVPGHDSHLVRRLKAAGFIPVGRTNMPELGILPVTEPVRYGPTRNPWDTDRTPGGSSGGSGAAVAAGMVPLAHGADGGGSIRIPAACCGLVGLKPARGRVSMGPDSGDHWLVAHGTLTRTVSETAALLDVLAGYEPGDATWAPPPAEPFAAAAAREPGRLRIGLLLAPPIEAPLDPICERAARDAAALLAELGHDVEEVHAPAGADDLAPIFLSAFGASIGLTAHFGAMLNGRGVTREHLEPLSWSIYDLARGMSAVDYQAAVMGLQAFARGFVAWSAAYDVLLTPSLAQRPVPIGEYDTSAADGIDEWARTALFTPYTAVANMSGQPAISLPFAHGEDGLPTGVHLVGRPADEATLLSLSSQLEQARPWADRRPELAETV
jgi:amidase